jgi:hypothetical protein
MSEMDPQMGRLCSVISAQSTFLLKLLPRGVVFTIGGFMTQLVQLTMQRLMNLTPTRQMLKEAGINSTYFLMGSR